MTPLAECHPVHQIKTCLLPKRCEVQRIHLYTSENFNIASRSLFWSNKTCIISVCTDRERHRERERVPGKKAWCDEMTTIPSLDGQNPIGYQLLDDTIHSWPHSGRNDALPEPSCALASGIKPLAFIRVSEDFCSGRAAQMKENFVRGMPWIMQWQSGFADLAEN